MCLHAYIRPIETLLLRTVTKLVVAPRLGVSPILPVRVAAPFRLFLCVCHFIRPLSSPLSAVMLCLICRVRSMIRGRKSGIGGYGTASMSSQESQWLVPSNHSFFFSSNFIYSIFGYATFAFLITMLPSSLYIIPIVNVQLCSFESDTSPGSYLLQDGDYPLACAFVKPFQPTPKQQCAKSFAQFRPR